MLLLNWTKCTSSFVARNRLTISATFHRTENYNRFWQELSDLYNSYWKYGKCVERPGILLYRIFIYRHKEAKDEVGEHDDDVGGQIHLVDIGWKPFYYFVRLLKSRILLQIPAVTILFILVTIFTRHGQAEADFAKIYEWLDKQVDREVTY